MPTLVTFNLLTTNFVTRINSVIYNCHSKSQIIANNFPRLSSVAQKIQKEWTELYVYLVIRVNVQKSKRISSLLAAKNIYSSKYCSKNLLPQTRQIWPKQFLQNCSSHQPSSCTFSSIIFMALLLNKRQTVLPIRAEEW